MFTGFVGFISGAACGVAGTLVTNGIGVFGAQAFHSYHEKDKTPKTLAPRGALVIGGIAATVTLGTAAVLLAGPGAFATGLQIAGVGTSIFASTFLFHQGTKTRVANAGWVSVLSGALPAMYCGSAAPIVAVIVGSAVAHLFS